MIKEKEVVAFRVIDASGFLGMRELGGEALNILGVREDIFSSV